MLFSKVIGLKLFSDQVPRSRSPKRQWGFEFLKSRLNSLRISTPGTCVYQQLRTRDRREEACLNVAFLSPTFSWWLRMISSSSSQSLLSRRSATQTPTEDLVGKLADNTQLILNDWFMVLLRMPVSLDYFIFSTLIVTSYVWGYHQRPELRPKI